MRGHLSSILLENKRYWTGRSTGYAELNLNELAAAPRHDRWKECLRAEIIRKFPGRDLKSLYALDIGTGPGFLAILLCELGLQVTAVDLTPAMLEKAEKNAGEMACRITFLEMNAEQLEFADDTFDVIVSRNLTWNLPHPEQAYSEWTRVLRPEGLLLNFDANWYYYLFDEEALEGYMADRENSAREGIRDANIGENFDVMEEIARRIPISGIRRPGWDLDILGRLGMHVEADENVGDRVWSREEKINFASTPMFMIRAGAY